MPDIKFEIGAIRQRLGLDRDLSPDGANRAPVGRSSVQLHQESGRNRHSEVVDSPRNEEAEYLVRPFYTGTPYPGERREDVEIMCPTKVDIPVIPGTEEGFHKAEADYWAGEVVDHKEELNRFQLMVIEAKKQLEERTRELNAIRAAATQVKKAPNPKKLAHSLYKLLATLRVDASTIGVDVWRAEAEGVVVGYEPEGQKKGTPHKEAVFALQPEGTCELNPYSRIRDLPAGVNRGKTINNRRELWESITKQPAPEWVEE